MGICLYPGLFNIPSVQQTLDAYKAITGRTLSLKEYLKIGERTVCMQRAFNAREGFTRKDDTLPKRLVSPLADGGAAGKAADLEYQLNEYYELRQWDKNGIPKREKLEALGLTEAAKDLHT